MHHQPDEETPDLATQDTDITAQQGKECAWSDPAIYCANLFRRRLVHGNLVHGHSRYSRPVRVRNTDSRLGEADVTSRIRRPAEAPTSTRRPINSSMSEAITRKVFPSCSTRRIPGRDRTELAMLAASPSYSTVRTLSGLIECFNAWGLPSARMRPLSMIAIRSQRASASSR